MRGKTIGAIAVAALFATSAWALNKGEHVYVRARDTRAYPKPGGMGQPTLLQPSAKAYSWEKHDKAWNQIRDERGKALWVYGPNLSLTPPQQELLAATGKASSMTDLSAADAIKGLGEGAQWYAQQGDEKAAGDRAAKAVATAEAISYHVENPSKAGGK